MQTAANVTQMTLGRRPVPISVQHRTRPDETMKALVWYGKRDVRVEDVPVPVVTNPQDVVCKVTGTTVCGSDLHLYHGEIMQLQKGDILGHEWMGVVDEVGPDVKTLRKGDRVVSSFQIACAECKFCKEDLSSMCDRTNTSRVQEMMYGQATGAIFGYSHFVGGYAGGQAEYVRCPFADNNLLKVPDHIPDEKVLYLSDIVPTSYHSVVRADVSEGKSVAIWGLGPIGLLAAQWCKLAKAKRVVGIDSVPERLAFVRDKLGCDVIDVSTTKDVVKALYELEPDGIDCAIDAAAFRYSKGVIHKVQRALSLETDTPEVINEALRAVRKFGTISLIADYAGFANGVNVGALMEKGITLRGCGQTPVQRYWHDLLKKVESGEMDPSMILTHRFKVDEFRELYDHFDKKDYGLLKVFVETRFSAPAAEGTPRLSSFKDGRIEPSRV